MKDHFAEIKLERPQVLYRQIRDQVRDLILSHKLGPGQKLPSTQELAATFGADVSTVQDALAPLVKEGLLVRAPRRGTFVRQRDERLTRVGIFLPRGPASFSNFQQALYSQLLELLHAAGMEPDVWVDPRPAAAHGEPWEPLVRAAEQRRVQAVVMIGTDLDYTRWVAKLPVPTAFWASLSLPQSVRSDGPMFADLTLEAAMKQGCRSVSMISPVRPDETDPYAETHIHAAFFRYFTERAAELGVTLRNDWMRLPDPTPAPAGRSGTETQHQYGYEEFQRLWDLPHHPEALIVAPDTVATGVIAAVLERQVRVPGELKLILAKNARTELFCPMPATFIITDERELARALLEQIQRQFRGEPCEPITIGFISAKSAIEPAKAKKGRKQQA